MAKRITAIVSLTLIGILIAATIILANVPISHNIKYNSPDYMEVFSGKNSNINIPLHKDEDGYKEILSKIEKATSEKILTALFEGHLNDGPVLNSETNQNMPTMSLNSSAMYVCFVYNEGQTLMDGNKVFKDENKNPYKYQQLCFEFTEDGESAKVYVIPVNNEKGEPYNPTSNKMQYRKYYVINTGFAELYNYLSTEGYKG